MTAVIGTIAPLLSTERLDSEVHSRTAIIRAKEDLPCTVGPVSEADRRSIQPGARQYVHRQTS
jgi:hypothetical protein